MPTRRLRLSADPGGHGAQSAPLPALRPTAYADLRSAANCGKCMRFGCAALGRVVRRILLAAQRLAGELNEVMGDEPHAENGVDLPAPQRVARRPPERLAIIRENSDVTEDAEGEHQCARKVTALYLAVRRRPTAM